MSSKRKSSQPPVNPSRKAGSAGRPGTAGRRTTGSDGALAEPIDDPTPPK